MQLTDLIYDLMVLREQLEDKGITDIEVYVKSPSNEYFYEIDSVTVDNDNFNVIINHI